MAAFANPQMRWTPTGMVPMGPAPGAGGITPFSPGAPALNQALQAAQGAAPQWTPTGMTGGITPFAPGAGGLNQALQAAQGGAPGSSFGPAMGGIGPGWQAALNNIGQGAPSAPLAAAMQARGATPMSVPMGGGITPFGPGAPGVNAALQAAQGGPATLPGMLPPQGVPPQLGALSPAAIQTAGGILAGQRPALARI